MPSNSTSFLQNCLSPIAGAAAFARDLVAIAPSLIARAEQARRSSNIGSAGDRTCGVASHQLPARKECGSCSPTNELGIFAFTIAYLRCGSRKGRVCQIRNIRHQFRIYDAVFSSLISTDAAGTLVATDEVTPG